MWWCPCNNLFPASIKKEKEKHKDKDKEKDKERDKKRDIKKKHKTKKKNTKIRKEIRKKKTLNHVSSETNQPSTIRWQCRKIATAIIIFINLGG